jgi:hydrogenase/urease accessory protein HupE
MRSSTIVAPLALVFASALAIEAHDPGLSRAEVTLGNAGVTAEVTFARRDLELLTPFDPKELLELDGVPPASVHLDAAASDGIHYSLRFDSARPHELRVPVLSKLARGHRQYVAVRDVQGKIVAQGLLGAAVPGLTVPATRVASFAARRFVVLGIEHILTGWDHLLFLLALLLAGGGIRRALGIVTAFTAAHSLSLALAALGIVHVPPALVEPVIAASIVWVAIENLLRRETRRRWVLAFAFGLVHGLGFASAIADAGLATQGLRTALGSLLSFNLGVESGQLFVLALAVPAAWALSRIPRLDVARATATASLVVAACGLYWIVERTIL